MGASEPDELNFPAAAIQRHAVADRDIGRYRVGLFLRTHMGAPETQLGFQAGAFRGVIGGGEPCLDIRHGVVKSLQ